MSHSAHVTSIEALKEFKAALSSFCEKAQDALCAVQMESRRLLDWLLHDQLSHWERQVRERQEEVVQARVDLNRVKLARATGQNLDWIEQQEALQHAQNRLREAEDKVQKVRHWGRVVQRAIEEYEAVARQLADRIEGDPPHPVSHLDQMIRALDSYVMLAPPATPVELTVSSPSEDGPIGRTGGDASAGNSLS